MSFVCQYVNSLYTGNKINCKFGNKCVCRTVIFISILLLRVVMVFLNCKQILLKRMTQRNCLFSPQFVHLLFPNSKDAYLSFCDCINPPPPKKNKINEK